MANTIKQSFPQKTQSARMLKATTGLQIFNKLTLNKTSVHGIKARRSVYKQRQTNTHLKDRTNTVKTQPRNSCTRSRAQLHLLQIPLERKVMKESNNK